jgi:hypothetical protein
VSDLRLKLFREHFPHALAVPFCSGGRLIDGSGMWNPSFRLTALRGRTLKNWFVRRALERSGVHRPVTFDLVTAVADVVAGADFDDRHLNSDGVRSLQGTASRDPVSDVAREYLFYWEAWKELLRDPSQPPPLAPAGFGLGPRTEAARP